MTLFFTSGIDGISYIIDEALIMIPVLFIIGEIIKRTTPLFNKWIPLILLIFSVAYTPIVIGEYTADNIVQAILIAGATVLGNELIKQSVRGDDENWKKHQ